MEDIENENRCSESNKTELPTTPTQKISYLLQDIHYAGISANVIAEGSIVGCPADAVNGVHVLVNYIAPHNGGDGSVRDFLEWLIQH